VRPKLDPYVAMIDKILVDDKSRPKKQQHTSKRIFERLRDEHGYTGGITIVKDYVAGVQQRAQEMFVPLAHPPGHAQADFGEALAVIGGVMPKACSRTRAEDPLLRVRPAALGRQLRHRVSGGDDGSVL
jgi:transposase